MEKLDQEVDTMRQELERQLQQQAHNKWQARVDALQQERSGDCQEEEEVEF
ncbi:MULTISPECIES: hypothetical protein [Aeromonas]|uniref:hypothetical protein n=1 Tax=Aeromonas TaxID=642 RepID=UPI000A9CF548|nr:hypothetical protein [Aeromonas lacus]